jgi:hypothetical protein
MFPNCPTPSIKKYINLKGLPHKKFSCMRCHWHRTNARFFAFENRSYLGEFEAEFKKAWARESGAQGGIIWWKKPRVEISRHCPFNGTFGHWVILKVQLEKHFQFTIYKRHDLVFFLIQCKGKTIQLLILFIYFLFASPDGLTFAEFRGHKLNMYVKFFSEYLIIFLERFLHIRPATDVKWINQLKGQCHEMVVEIDLWSSSLEASCVTDVPLVN